MAAGDLLVELPMYVNLGDVGNWESVIGQAKVFRDPETGKNTIEIALEEEASVKLGNMVDIFELKAIGFAGIKRKES